MWLLQAILTSNSMTCENRVLNFVLHSVGHFQKRELVENNNVILVGDPLYNKKIREMFYQIVEDRLGKPE